mgnify:CR=1 FL=1
MSDTTEGPQSPETPGDGDPAPSGSPDPVIAEAVELQKQSADDHHTPGTVVLTFVFLVCFAIYYFANWKALADVWYVR